MPRSRLAPLLAAVACCVACSGTTQQVLSLQVDATPVNPRVVVFAALGVNASAIATADGLVVVDSHRSPATMAAIHQAMRAHFGRATVTHVVNTHGHWDHSSGNQLFAGATIVGHAVCPQLMRLRPATSPRTLFHLERDLESAARPDSPSDRDEEHSATRAMLASLEDDYVVTPPRRTFSDRLVLDVGGKTLRLLDCAGTHSDSDILVYLPQERLVFTGDILCSATNPCFPVDGARHVDRVLAALDEVLAAGVDTVVPGHGPLLDGAGLRTFRDALAERWAPVAAHAEAVRALEPDLASPGAAAARRRAVQQCSEEELDRLAERLFFTGAPEPALELLAAALAAHPDSWLLHGTLAEMQLDLGRRDTARASFQRAATLGPWDEFAAEMTRRLR